MDFVKVNDRAHLRCISPEPVYGLQWELACFDEWYSGKETMGWAQQIWTFLMVAIVIFTGSVCILMSVKKCIEGRKLTRQEHERIRNLEEARDVYGN